MTFSFRDGLEDPLEDQGMVSQQLEQLSTIGRCEYEKTCSLLVQLFDESAQRYQELVTSGGQTLEIAVQEGTHLEWEFKLHLIRTLSTLLSHSYLRSYANIDRVQHRFQNISCQAGHADP